MSVTNITSLGYDPKVDGCVCQGKEQNRIKEKEKKIIYIQRIIKNIFIRKHYFFIIL